MEKIIFFNIGWMKHYQGITAVGQANVWYAQREHKTTVDILEKVEQLISQYRNLEITKLSSIQQELDRNFFNTITLEDARERVLTSIVRRRGQSQFRQQLLTAYKDRCAISGCDVEQALEAAHIIPYRGIQTNNTCNGLLLRADLHTLFDLKLITIEPETMKVLIAPKLMKTQCRAFFQRKISLPESEADRPDKKAIEEHYIQCKWTRHK
ncbi:MULTISPECIES: HNH endonuclease [unclassified Nostoc]|uniref:HNH endonuclease n=1 Tax=unclassified Nostoc TaxID=2593658 RepID=UPI0018EF7A23|nr:MULTISPECIES: HNH endonuclease [unclassified Nostoc]